MAEGSVSGLRFCSFPFHLSFQTHQTLIGATFSPSRTLGMNAYQEDIFLD